MAITKVTSSVLSSGSATDGYVLTADGSGNSAWEEVAGGPTFKTFGTDSIMIGDTTTGTINAADQNTGLGVDVFAALTEGDGNTAIGKSALTSNTTGTRNTAVGAFALDANTTGLFNTAVGYSSGTGITTAFWNTYMGDFCGALTTTGGSNTAMGQSALYANTTGANNTAVGKSAGGAVTTGIENCFLGDSAGLQNTTGARNVMIGYRGGRGNSVGNDCIIIGSDASYTSCTGSRNVAIGNNAGYNWTTAYNNTVIGYNSRTDEYNSYGAIVIGYNGLGISSESVTFVNGSNKTYVGIGSTNWAGTSDQRLKENVQTSTAGLSFINDLRPVTFDWKKKKDIDNSLEAYEEDSEERYIKNNPVNRHGFVAQEVKTALDNHPEVLSGSEIWNAAKDGTQGISEVALIPMLVKALQEADDKIDALTTRIEALEN